MIRVSTLGFVATVVTSSILASSVAAQSGTRSDELFAGVWRLNVERSVWTPGPRPPSDLVSLRQYSPLEGGWFRFVQGSVNQQGAPTLGIGVYKLDGQRHPVHNIATLGPLMSMGRPSNVTRAYRAIDARTTESITYTDGVAAIPLVRSLAPDGMTFIETAKGTGAQGNAVHNVLVWERVR